MLKGLAFALLLSLPVAAFFHTKLTKAEPGVASTVTTAPTQIRLWFSEEPERELTTVSLEKAADSSVIAKLVLAATDDPKSVVGKIPAPLPPGSYLVVWKTAADDGHPAKGSYWFTFKPKQP
jgi:methionine-rich copper-binding protein CopC